MKPEEIIRLRGHHLRVLRFYCNFRFCYSTVEKRTRFINSVKYYGNYHAAKVAEILKKIRQPANNIFFEITDRIDDICRSCKKRRYWECCRSGRMKTSVGMKFFHTAAKEDKKIVRRFGLEIGKIYSAKEILKALRD